MRNLLIIVSFALVLFFGSTAESSAASNTYTVKSGDTLYKISQLHKVTVDNLKSWNGLKSNTIYPNQQLKVSGTAAKQPATKAVTKPAVDQPTAVASAPSTYTVKSGDTLYKISQLHKMTVDQLKSWNGLSSNTIYPNQKLKVNGGIIAQAAAPSRSSSSETAVKEITVSASAYTASCNGCSGITKTGINLRENPGLKVIAVDPSVIKLGTKVYVEGYGYAVAGDVGSAIKGNKIDVFIPSRSAALQWGRKTVKVKILN